MIGWRAPLFLVLLDFSSLFGQAPPAAFEVASIRTGAPFSMDLLRSGGIGMKIEPGRVVIRSWSFSDLIGAAYRVRTDQIEGPDWMSTFRFDIQATMPRESTAEQVPEMLQALLAARFQLRARRSQKEMTVYALTVKKGGPRVQESAPTDTTSPGCVILSGGHRLCHRMTMSALADLLTQLSRMYAAMPPGGMNWGIEAPAVDMTGITAAYDFAMDYGPGPEEAGGGSVIDAIDRLGLKLEKQKRPNDLIVVEHLEKAPTAN
jgi:uncharacterized protein (TIGR03435 family)